MANKPPDFYRNNTNNTNTDTTTSSKTSNTTAPTNCGAQTTKKSTNGITSFFDLEQALLQAGSGSGSSSSSDPEQSAASSSDEWLGETSDEWLGETDADEIIGYMTALEAMTRDPVHARGPVHPAAATDVPTIELGMLDTLMTRLPWLDSDSSACSDSDSDGGFSLPVLPTTGPLTAAADLGLPHPYLPRYAARATAAVCPLDVDFARLGDDFGDGLFEHTVQALASAPTSMAVDAAAAAASPQPSPQPLPQPAMPATTRTARRAGNRRAVTIAPGSKHAAIDTQLLTIFSDADFRLSKHEWAKRLRLARLSTAQEARAKQLRRKILSRRYADDNRKKNARQINAVADERARLLADNDALRADNAKLMAELASLKRTFGSR